jgi:hypothetical protein
MIAMHWFLSKSYLEAGYVVNIYAKAQLKGIPTHRDNKPKVSREVMDIYLVEEIWTIPHWDGELRQMRSRRSP